MKKIISAILILLFSFQFAFSQETINENQKLTSLCKIWGFLKYYHPSVAKGKFMWDEELINKISEIEKVNSKTELNELYNSWLTNLGEVPKIEIKPNEKEYFEKNFNLNWIKDKSIFNDNLIERLTFIEQNRNQDGQFYISRKGIKAELTNELNYANSFPTKDIRIVEFFRFWNLVEYFYPHKYKIQEDWNNLLTETIPEILNCKNHTSYHLIYVKLLEKMKDSHAYFHSQPLNAYFGMKVTPVVSKYSEGKLIITEYKDKKLANENNLFVGDIISKINNRTIDEIFEKKKKYIIAANDAKKMKIFTNLDYFFTSSKDTVSVTIERESKIFNNTIKTYYRKELDKTNKETIDEKIKWKKLENNIGYFNMKNSDVPDVEEIYENLKNSKAIIFDIRNYPNYFGKEIVEKFGKSKKVSAKNIYADLDYPGKFYWKDIAYGTEKEISPYNGKIIILVDENSQSRSEWTAMQLQTLENSFIIGSQTAGSDGELLKYKINDIETAFTINGVFYPNKDETQGCGIKIDVEIKPTLKGLKANKDEVLERAIQFINNGK
jgi:C-terminal processing protease CtpA/Prc